MGDRGEGWNTHRGWEGKRERKREEERERNKREMRDVERKIQRGGVEENVKAIWRQRGRAQSSHHLVASKREESVAATGICVFVRHTDITRLSLKETHTHTRNSVRRHKHTNTNSTITVSVPWRDS